MTHGYGPKWLATRACALAVLLLYCAPGTAGTWSDEDRLVVYLLGVSRRS
jgi:hypothetical protein